MCELNEQQQDAVNFQDGIAMIVAVPGSGKTMIMTRRIAKLVKNGVAPENILGIAFTRNAAKTLRKRLQSILSKQASRIALSTIHSFCYQVLQNEETMFDILDDFKKTALIRKILKKYKINDLPLALTLSEISSAKNRLIFPAQYMKEYGDDPTLQKIGRVYRDYEDEKDKKYWLDFEDLLTDTYQLFSENESIRNRYSSIYRHILIDEYQDTNPAQLEVIKLLVNDRANRSLYVVGDDSQSIYSFTGASIYNILQFRKMFPTAYEFRLTLNYRSTPQILKACENLISHNRLKIDKELKTNNADGERVILMKASSEEKEANQVVDEIQAIINHDLYKLKDIVILYRANAQSRALEEVLLQQNIPYQLEKSMNFYQRLEIRPLLNYLRVLNDPTSKEADRSLLKILNVPNRYLSNRFKRDLKDYAVQQGVSVFTALKDKSYTVPYEEQNAKELLRFMKLMFDEVAKKTPAQMIALLRSSLRYDAYIVEEDIPSPDDPKIANINQLQLAASKFDHIQPFLDHTSQFKKKNKGLKGEDKVRLMTIHKSKGMEFPVVFIVGLADGILPLKQADIEEERRIAFVGMSRASSLLHLSYSTSYNNRDAAASSFLTEITRRRVDH